MRIAYGTTVLHRALSEDKFDGIGRYTSELMRSLACVPGLELVPFAYTGCTLHNSVPSPVLAGSFKRQALLALLAGRDFRTLSAGISGRADVLHATDHFIPRLRSMPVVATLHDAIPLAHPEWISYSCKRLKNSFWKKTATWADRVITVSEHSKREIAHWFGIPEQNIRVTPLGVGHEWFEEVPREEMQRVKMKHGLPERFFFFVGTLHPRKNVMRLIEAHRALPSHIRREIPLVVAGRAGWQCGEEVAALESGDGGALRWLRWLPEDDLPAVFKQASVFVLPSLHEGFGLPVLEAFAAGTPVVASNAGAIPEVAGDAAILVDPPDVGALAQAMRRVAEDTMLADSLRAKGRERARQFTWERTARLTADVYREVLIRDKDT